MDDESKRKHSKRIQNDETAIAKQVKIAVRHGVPITDPGKFSKRHAMSCGDSNCVMCGNPRKFFGELTPQEKRLFQDTDTTRDKRGNGTLPEQE
jgi:hypothetical protein